MKKLRAISLACAVIGGLAGTASADDVYSANIVGYAYGGAGFEFSPNTQLSVTALGYIGVDVYNAPYQVSLWDATGDALASALVSTNSPESGPGFFQPISAVSLDPGSIYYMGAVRPDAMLWLGDVIITSGPDADGTFTVAPQITYLSYATGTNSSGAFPGATYGEPGIMLVGADFEFQLPAGGMTDSMEVSSVPEPSVVGLAACALAALAFSKRRS